mmetsp:Transcript_40020/g.111184  ORF Transcript_40020/g.111184 Transcript_40020/m.111184 type:complete len:208 (+) Transcript_40020:358-981(+)
MEVLEDAGGLRRCSLQGRPDALPALRDVAVEPRGVAAEAREAPPQLVLQALQCPGQDAVATGGGGEAAVASLAKRELLGRELRLLCRLCQHRAICVPQVRERIADRLAHVLVLLREPCEGRLSIGVQGGVALDLLLPLRGMQDGLPELLVLDLERAVLVPVGGRDGEDALRLESRGRWAAADEGERNEDGGGCHGAAATWGRPAPAR